MCSEEGVRYFVFGEARYNWSPLLATFIRALALPDTAAQRLNYIYSSDILKVSNKVGTGLSFGCGPDLEHSLVLKWDPGAPLSHCDLNKSNDTSISTVLIYCKRLQFYRNFCSQIPCAALYSLPDGLNAAQVAAQRTAFGPNSMRILLTPLAKLLFDQVF